MTEHECQQEHEQRQHVELLVQSDGVVMVETSDQVKELLRAREIIRVAAAAAVHGTGVHQTIDAPAVKHGTRLPERSTSITRTDDAWKG